MKEETQKESSGVQRILGQKHISWKNGEFFLWNIPGMIFPIHSIIDIVNSIKRKYGHESNHLLYEIGERQTVIAIDYMIKRFGFKREIDVINSVLQQSSVLGYGDFKVIKLNLENCNALIESPNNPFAKQHRLINGVVSEPIDYYFSGTIAGMAEAVTGKTLASVETKCIAKGDPCCLFEVTKPGEVLPKYSHQLPQNLVGPAKIREMVEKAKEIISSPKP